MPSQRRRGVPGVPFALHWCVPPNPEIACFSGHVHVAGSLPPMGAGPGLDA